MVRGRRARAGEEDVIDAFLMRAPSAIREHTRLGTAVGLRVLSIGSQPGVDDASRRQRRIQRLHQKAIIGTRVLPVHAAAADVEVAEHQDRVRRAVHLAADERRQLFDLAPAHRAVLGAGLHMGDEDVDQVIVGARQAGVQDALGGEPVLFRGVAVDVAIDRNHGQPTGQRELVADERQPRRCVLPRPGRRRTRTYGRRAGARVCRTRGLRSPAARTSPAACGR